MKASVFDKGVWREASGPRRWVAAIGAGLGPPDGYTEVGGPTRPDGLSILGDPYVVERELRRDKAWTRWVDRLFVGRVWFDGGRDAWLCQVWVRGMAVATVGGTTIQDAVLEAVDEWGWE